MLFELYLHPFHMPWRMCRPCKGLIWVSLSQLPKLKYLKFELFLFHAKYFHVTALKETSIAIMNRKASYIMDSSCYFKLTR